MREGEGRRGEDEERRMKAGGCAYLAQTKLLETTAGRRMGRKVTLACCALNQWALDFEGNLRRIKESK